MTDASEMYDAIMRELNNVFISETDESEEEQGSPSLHEGADSGDIPPSLLSYFETSRSRAAVFREKLVLEELEDVSASHHAEDMMKLNEQVTWDTENEDPPTETEALYTHNVSACPNDGDEAGTDEYKEREKHLAFEVRTLEMPLKEEERKKSSGYEAEREKRRREEEMKKEEQKRQIERDFQEELRKIMEEEKLHQKELELMGKRAQEKLEQELLLQQELINNLQRRVEEERRMREEEQKRMKDEEDERKREEENVKIEAERNRVEEEARRKKEEEEEVKLKKEEERKNEEEEKRRMEREESNRRDLEMKKKLEDEMRMMKEEEERKKKEELERIKKEEGKREEQRKKIEEAMMKIEKEKRKMEEEMSLKKEEKRKKREEENMRIEEEWRIAKEIEERRKKVEVRKKKEEKEADDRRKMYEEMRKRDKIEHGNVDEEIQLEERKRKEEKDRKKEEEEEEEEARKREKERKKMAEKEVKEVIRKNEGENIKVKEELRPIAEDEKRKKEDERKTKEEERRRRQREEEDYRKSKEEIRLKEDEEEYEGCDVDKREMEHESKTKDKEMKQEGEEKRNGEEERVHVEAGKEQDGEEVGEVNKTTAEDMRLKEKEESKKRTVQEREKEANELREKRKERQHNHMVDQNEKQDIDKRENSPASQQQDSWTSLNPGLGPLHSESTICPVPQQHDRDQNISQTSADKTAFCENQAARPLSPACLPEHTEQKRLSWMKDCMSWSRLSLQNRRKRKGCGQRRRGPRRATEAGSLPLLCPGALLRSTGCKSLQEVTTVTLEDLPGCSLSTLAQCVRLRSLTLRRCGLRSLEGLNQLAQLCYIDVQENDISFVDCENMTSLRVLQLGRNKLTSIHGLTGAENLDVLDLSHNSITRIAGLESLRRLQRLSVDHNQLISTDGLRDVCTLLHLDCSHNHLASVEGLQNSALLNTLDLRANSLTEPPTLNNQVLLRQLHLDDNSISSLEALCDCWLPLMQHLSVAQNRITQLPPMSDWVSLANLDLRFNCVSELQNVCESLEGCQFLCELHLMGNPLQQEPGWRSALQRAVPGLRVAADDRETDPPLSPPAARQVSVAPGGFLSFCQAQLQQSRNLQQQHSRECGDASSSPDAVKTSCRHFAEALQLAKDQRFAHEYGDTTVAAPEETLDMDCTNAVRPAERPETESAGKVPPVIRRSYWSFEEKSAAESRHDSLDTMTTGPETRPTVNSLATQGKTVSSNIVSNHQHPDLQNTAAVVIQQLWRKYRKKCGNIGSPSTADMGGGRGGGGAKPESGPSYVTGSQDCAATVIQALWRGFTLRRRLASALAAVTRLDAGGGDTLEEVDVDEFALDEAALEKHWTLLPSEDSPPGRYPESEQPLSLKPPGPFPEPSQCVLPAPLVWRSKQAWVAGEQVDSASPVSSIRSKSPASTSAISGLSERSEKILEEWGFTHSHTALLMLKRAQKMKSKKQQQKKHRDPLFRNCSYQLGPVEARNRQAQHNRSYTKVREAELGLQRAERTERAKQERAQQWLQSQAAHSDRHPESLRFLPEISSDILNGGRVQLVAEPGYTERPHHAGGLRANSSSAAQPRREDDFLRRNSPGLERNEVPPPERVASAPSRRERISFRDDPVQLSGGWGGGKKRDRVHK